MNDYEVFEQFNQGRLCLPKNVSDFSMLEWLKHPKFDGVELKHIITSNQSDGQFSFHLVKIAPNKRIGLHIHDTQLETHEVVAGQGICMNDGVELKYEAGMISMFPKGIEHEVIAGEQGLFLFAKFFPALC